MQPYIPRPPRHRFRSSSAAAALGLAAALAVPVAAAAPAVAAEDNAPMLKLALTGDIDTLNPFISILATSSNVLRLQYEPLVAYGAEANEEIPGMAESWETSEDGTVWTFSIPEGRQWSDGEPITAEDAEWTFNAIMENDDLKQANGSVLSSVESVEAEDDTTLVITLSEAQAVNPGTELPIVPEHVWSELDDPAGYANDKETVGSGPFVVDNYDKSAGVTMTTNPNYWRGAAKISGVTWIPYKNSDAAVQALRTGEIDIVSGLTPAQYQALENEPNITTNAGTGRRYQAIGINPGAQTPDGTPMGDGHPALQDVQVRRAVALAIDSDTLLEKVLQGLGDKATGEIPMTYPLYHWDTDELPLAYDPDAANKLLDEAGYEMGPDGVRLDKDGNALSMRLMGRNSDPTHQQMADYVKPWLKEIGIDVSVEMKAPAQVNDDSTVGNYDLYFTGWGIGPDPDFQLSINQCSSRPNADGTGATSENNYCDPAFDELYKAQHAELDQEKRSELVAQAQEMIYNAAVNKVLYYANSLEAYRSDRWEPFVTQPAEGGVITSQNGPWSYYQATPAGELDEAGVVTDDDSNTGMFIGVGGAVLVAGLVAFLLIRRRSATADDRE